MERDIRVYVDGTLHEVLYAFTMGRRAILLECPQLIITEESETIPSAPTQTSGSQGSAGRSSQPHGPGSSGSSRGPGGRGYRGRDRGTPSAHPDRSLTQAKVFAVTQ